MIKVSVVMATYNHEKYIEKALDSVIRQKCDFEYEILVGDDASKDSTGSIVRAYSEKYPDKIRAFVRVKNLGAVPNIVDLVNNAKGEYVAFLEGDDFWIDDEKLQKQISFLDEHKDFAACFGKCIVVDENNDRQEDYEKYIPFFLGDEFTANDLEQYYLPGQTATAVYRVSAFKNLERLSKKDKRIFPRCPVIDRFLVLAILSQGRIKSMPDTFAAYRYVLSKSSGSWSSKHDSYSFRNIIAFLYGLKELERVAKRLGINICFDERRRGEFAKVADYKGKMSILTIDIIRFFIWLWYKDKKDLYKFVKERHGKNNA